MSEKEYRQHRFERPSGATEILLIRHGESSPLREGEPFPLVDGHGDPGLAAQGREQADKVGVRLKNHPVDAVYVTKLRRTHETAAPLCRHLEIEPVIEPNLHEVHLGEWEGGVFRVKAAEQDPIFLKMHEEERWDVIPGAESYSVFSDRVNKGLRNIVRSHPDQLVVAVLHGGVIGQILAQAAGSTGFAFNGADNGSISHIVVNGAQTTIRRFNDCSHLQDLMSSAGAMPT